MINTMLSGSDILASAKNINQPNKNASYDKQNAQKVANDFEAFFLSQTLEQMYAGIKTDGFFGGGDAEKIWRSFLFDEYGKQMVKAGGIGMAKEVMNYMLEIQENSQSTSGVLKNE